jgi:flavin reductase (DIM6/NTAB) family NADH-FMN oxidoreductase RutF
MLKRMKTTLPEAGDLRMKKEYSSVPLSMSRMETFGFSWMDFVTAIPSPLFVVTSYKANGKPNACLQSWACFSGDTGGFYAILSSVSKEGHLYGTIRERGVAVLNFPSADIYARCMKTIAHNGLNDDEIALAGLTAESAAIIDAPRIRECFLNLECRYLWEREIKAGDTHVLMCLEAVNVCLDRAHMSEAVQGRYGESGYLYNVHYPVDPENFRGRSQDWIAILQKYQDMGEY